MLRQPQVDFKTNIYNAWGEEGVQNVMGVAPTGFGKTVVMGSVIQDFDAPTCAIAHRQELVSQISLAMNNEEIPHGIVAPPEVRREIIKAHMDFNGRSYFNPASHIRVAGVDSLRNFDKTDRWLQQVRLVIQDEGHHVLAGNKWGRAAAMFPNSRGLLLTAHALRADGRGLGRHADGIVDRLVIGPSCRETIDAGYLTDYRVICPPSDIDLNGVGVSAETGDYKQDQLREAVHASNTIVGDVVKHYRQYADGELGITFAVDVASAEEIAAAFMAARIPAAVITAKTPIGLRGQLMKQFRERKLIQLVNVDVLGEGTDVPACTVVSMARPTASFQLCAQQFGRMLRILVSRELGLIWGTFTDEIRLAHIAASTKPTGILIDHVGNIAIAGGIGRHGLPDRPRTYTLDRRERKNDNDDAEPLRVCTNPECKPLPFQPYSAFKTKCPRCLTEKPPPRGRSTPEMVDGDLVELDPEVLAEMRGAVEKIDRPPAYPKTANPAILGAFKRNHWERQQQQGTLRDAISTWAGWQKHLGREDRETYRRFFHGFGVDIVTAQGLGAKEAAELETRIRIQLFSNNVVTQ